MAVIYRIQDKHGRGPFKPGTSMRWLDNMVKRCGVLEPWYITWPQIHPANYPHHHLACGCLTLPQLRQWFSADEYQKLKELGYAAVRLEADRVIQHNDIQCVFIRRKGLRRDVQTVELYRSGAL